MCSVLYIHGFKASGRMFIFSYLRVPAEKTCGAPEGWGHAFQWVTGSILYEEDTMVVNAKL